MIQEREVFECGSPKSEVSILYAISICRQYAYLAIDLDGLEEMKANSVFHIIKDISGNVINKPTTVRASGDVSGLTGVRRIDDNYVEITPGFTDKGGNSEYFNTFTWQQVEGNNFYIKQANTPVGQDVTGIKPPQTNLVQTNDGFDEPSVPNNPKPVLRSGPPKINGHPVGKEPIHLSVDASFDANTDNINNKASVMKQVKQIVTALKSNPKISITLSGNTYDPSTGPLQSDPNLSVTLNGQPSTNRGVQDSRAKAVGDILTKQGVNRKQIKYGSGSVSKDPKRG